VVSHKVDYNDFCFNCDAACCPEMYYFTLLRMSWQLIAQLELVAKVFLFDRRTRP